MRIFGKKDPRPLEGTMFPIVIILDLLREISLRLLSSIEFILPGTVTVHDL